MHCEWRAITSESTKCYMRNENETFTLSREYRALSRINGQSNEMKKYEQRFMAPHYTLHAEWKIYKHNL